MNEREKSDRPVVPVKSAKMNYWEFHQRYVESMKGRGLAKEKEEETNLFPADPAKQVDRTPSRVREGVNANSEDLSQALDRIRRAACRKQDLRFTSLWHHVCNVDRLAEAYRAIKHDAAAGVDGQTWQEYGKDLKSNLKDLSERLASGAYRAQPVRRVYIPKADGKERPIGIPALEDKIAQRATVQVLNAIYEADFAGFSYGFRPGRSCHMALDALAVGIERKKVNWILDADIKSFFDSLSHERLIEFVEKRIADPRVVRHIRKWLNAGVLEDGRHVKQEEGTPQGGSISPLLANIYLHYVLDMWAWQWKHKQARGERTGLRPPHMIIVRYADDFVAGFEHESDAQRFLAELRKRFAQYSLELHAEKTRVIQFGRKASKDRKRREEGKPLNFNFLGFVHVCDKTRRGRFIVLRRTMVKRMRSKLASIKQELRRRMHDPVRTTGSWLRQVVSGYYRYFGVPRNLRSLYSFRDAIRRLWHRMLRRRCQSRRAGLTTQTQMTAIATRWLPLPCVCHPYPVERLRVMIHGKSPVR